MVIVVTMMVAVAANTGCSAPKAPAIFSMNSTWPFRDKDAPRKGTPVRIVSTWTDTVLHQPGQTPQRGFGGRLVFYDRDSKEPILVDGQLVVYAFDESGRDLLDNKPTRRYVFPADQLPLHMSKSEIGTSYSFWLPWDDAGGPRTEVSLICRFEPKGGAVITSEQTRQLLPGTLPADSAVASREPARLPEGVPHRPALPSLEEMQRRRQAERTVQHASYQSAAEPPAAGAAQHLESAPSAADRRMVVTSISLPETSQLRTATTSPPPSAPHTATRTPPSAPRHPTPETRHPTSDSRPPTADNRPPATPGAWPIARPQFLTTQPTVWQPGITNGATTTPGAWNTVPPNQPAAPR